MVNSKFRQDRVDYLDGLRGLAILLVVFFHAFYRWRDLEPWQQPMWIGQIASHGLIGVQLFFMISGFVIFMTLERTQGFTSFLARRWLRLFPAMLLASVLIFALSWVLDGRPEGPLSLIDLVPGLTFIAPWNLAALTGIEMKSADGAFWSIYVEVVFYVIVSFSFFVFHDRGAYVIQAMYLFWFGAELAEYSGYEVPLLPLVLGRLEAGYFGWFALGIYAFKYATNPRPAFLGAIGLYALAAPASFALNSGVWMDGVTAFTAVVVFLLPLWLDGVRKLYSHPAFLFLGFVSYPLYLIHQNTVTGAGIWLHQRGLELSPWAMPIGPILATIALAYLIASSEPKLKVEIRSRFKALFSRGKLQFPGGS